ncbi:MAG: PilZ domain-containing protein [Rhizobacter sp.]|nr:PilZ domain-containing protein [Bacteriovorax sp.]
MKFSSLIPSSLKGLLIRRFHSVKKVKNLKNVSVKLAESFEEYKQASELLHDCYVAKNLMIPHPSGLRANIHSFLPHNSVVIAVNEKGEVIGTVSLIKDTSLMLPADSIFNNEVTELRKKENRQIVEVSALAIHPSYRHESHSLQFLLNKYLYIYTRDFLKANTLLIVVHPRAAYFYNGLLFFKAVGKIISYEFVKGAPARLMYMDFSGDWEVQAWEKYNKRKDSIIDFVLNHKDDQLIFKNEADDILIMRNKKMSMELFRRAQFDVRSLNIHQTSCLISGLNLTPKDIDELGITLPENVLEYRFDKKFNATVVLNDQSCIFVVYNVSSGGAYIELPKTIQLKTQDLGKIKFKWRGEFFTSLFKVRWINTKSSDRLPPGIGVKFLDAELSIFDEEINYRKKKPA